MNTLTKSFQDVTSFRSAILVLESLSPNDLLVYSPSSLGRLNNVSLPAHAINARQLDRRKDLMDAAVAGRAFSRVIGFGGGTALDTAKYIANSTNAELIFIPAILSTNAFATNKVALYDGELKVTLDAKLADEIIFDDQALKLSSSSLHRFGLADVASIHTALFDWRLAANATGEEIDDEIYARAQHLLSRLSDEVSSLDATIPAGLKAVYELVGESGHITNLYGSGRPESGSEHIIAKAIEHGRMIPHGISISLSIVMASISRTIALKQPPSSSWLSEP
jgi:glycerol dehydrogenase-like iron-containing ADH family enzyme